MQVITYTYCIKVKIAQLYLCIAVTSDTWHHLWYWSPLRWENSKQHDNTEYSDRFKFFASSNAIVVIFALVVWFIWCRILCFSLCVVSHCSRGAPSMRLIIAFCQFCSLLNLGRYKVRFDNINGIYLSVHFSILAWKFADCWHERSLIATMKYVWLSASLGLDLCFFMYFRFVTILFGWVCNIAK